MARRSVRPFPQAILAGHVARRIRATTAGANLELPGGRARALLARVSRTTGAPRVTRDAGVPLQLQVRF